MKCSVESPFYSLMLFIVAIGAICFGAPAFGVDFLSYVPGLARGIRCGVGVAGIMVFVKLVVGILPNCCCKK